ncbi:MAG: tyrosine-type recombinase/integrase [Clostridiales bacterium]|jgi:integrase|nr:tyrosine-type recombinase/integrase [Clostridiales bacterium]
MATSDPIRNVADLQRLADYYLNKGQLRNFVLVVLGSYTALRISDLLRLKWRDVYDFERARVRLRVYVTEGKTGKTKSIAINANAAAALRRYFAQTPKKEGDFLFPNNRKTAAPICRVQAYRIIRAAAKAVRVEGHISCHSLRKTFGYHAWKSGASAVLLMDIYNHTSFEVTRRYLGICQDDRDKLYLRMRLVV